MMLKKLLLIGVCALTFAAAGADDFISVTFNFYAPGEIDPDGDLPAGMVMVKNIPYNNKKLPGRAHSVDIRVDGTQTLDQTFTVTGEGKLVISVNTRTMINGRYARTQPKIRCTELVVNGKATKTPFVFNSWRYASDPIFVKDGDKITVRATFEPAE